MERVKRIFLAMSVLILPYRSFAAVPNLINFQGRLCDISGNAVTTQTTVTVDFFNQDAGGASIFSESHSVSPDVNGIYNLFIGANTSLAGVNFGNDIWIEVTAGGEVLSPRYRLTTSPYAFRAAFADAVDWSAVSGVPANVTLQGNTFNGANNLLQLDSTGRLPAVDGSQLVNLPSIGVGTGPVTFISSVTVVANQFGVGGDDFIVNNSQIGVNTDSPHSTLHVNGSFATRVRTLTASGAVNDDDHIILVDAGVSVVTLTLPSAVGRTGRQYIIKKSSLTLNVVTIDPAGAETIDSLPTYTVLGSLLALGSVTIVSNGANWFVLGSL